MKGKFETNQQNDQTIKSFLKKPKKKSREKCPITQRVSILTKTRAAKVHRKSKWGNFKCNKIVIGFHVVSILVEFWFTFPTRNSRLDYEVMKRLWQIQVANEFVTNFLFNICSHKSNQELHLGHEFKFVVDSFTTCIDDVFRHSTLQHSICKHSMVILLMLPFNEHVHLCLDAWRSGVTKMDGNVLLKNSVCCLLVAICMYT